MNLQKLNKYHFKKIEISFLLLMLLAFITIQAQNENQQTNNEPLKARMYLDYNKYSNDTKSLTAKLFIKEGKYFIPVTDAVIVFSAENNTTEIALGSIKTNQEGLAILHISKDYKLPGNLWNFCTFRAKYEGNNKHTPVESEIEIKNLFLNFSFIEIDRIKTIEINVSEPDNTGEKISANEVEVFVYVERLHSLLNIGEKYTDEEGKAIVEFPTDLPGDSIGNVNIIVRIKDSDKYGNVEKIKTIKWGIPVSYEQKEIRALWAEEAPLWLIIVVSVILISAWVAFFLAVFKVYKIKKSE